MNKKPLVSIVIPYYNREEKFKRCLQSIFSQTYTHYEIIVVDDYSSIPLKMEFDSRISVYRNQKNLGPGQSRNRGLDNAKGDYIAFLDSDDYWDSKFLINCLQCFFENGDISMVFCNGYEVNEEGKVIGIRRKKVKTLDSILPEILQGSRHWGTGGCLWKREHLKNVTWQSTTPWEDYAFDIDVAIQCNKISGLKDCLVFYDTTGKDKISKQNREQAVLGKNKSLIYISQALRNSEFRYKFEIKQAITVQLINNIISIVGLDIHNKNIIPPLLNELKRWNGFYFSLYLEILGYLPKKTQLRLLRRLKS